MALGSAYEDEAIQALANSPVRAQPAPEAKFSAWRVITAVPRAAVEFGAQRMGVLAEVASGFGQVAGAYPEVLGAAGPSLSADQRRQADAQRRRLLTGGVDMSSEAGDLLREAGRSYRPDPVTAHAAEQVVYGFTRGAAKLVSDTLMFGPAGPLVAGADEAMSAADDLRLQGVDIATRTKAGAVQGAGLALAALPVVGQSAAATAGLYAVGGPGGFIAQQALTREILQGAGYDKISAQFDPFDPVGLAVATLLPAGFAAYGLRQQKLQRAVESLPDLPPRADAAPPADPAAPAPMPSRLSPVADAVRAYPTEAVDAARVVLLAERRAAANPGAPDNLRAMDQHEAALTRAEDQLAAGEAVQVADVAPTRAAADGLTFAQRLDAAIAERGYSVLAGDLSQMVAGTMGERTITIADMPEAEFMAKHGNPVEDVKAHEFAHAYWAGATGLPNFRDPRNKPLLADLRAVSREFRPTVWETHKAHANKPDELLADGMAFWLKNPERRAEFPQLDKMMRGYDAGDLVRRFPDVQPFDTWAADITSAARDMQAQARPTDAPTTPQATNPEAAAPARGAGEPPAAASTADAGRGAGVEADGLTGSTGATAEVVTERGTSVPVRYRLAEARDLTTSHTNDLTANPAFPPELQPRDRARAASAEQISRIENNLRPQLLGESVKASDGAPIVGPDAVVESGNARTIALRRAYESGKADAYRAWLADNAERFGLTRQQVESMQQPVLVRERLGNVDRAEFARQANESAVSAMSPSEQAMSDARRITDLTGLVANEDGTINMAQSADFVRRFIQQAVAPTERGAMLQASGQLSQAGMTRLRNAVFAKAYGDADILAMLTESTDANVRNILAGMLRAAPEVAKLTDLAQAGARQDADIAGPLVEAVRLFSQLRSEGRTVQQFMAQGSMFGDGLSPEIAAMLEAVSLNARAPKRIAEMIGRMVDTVNALGDARQMGMFGDAPTGADAVAGAAEQAVMDSRLSMAAEKFPALEVMVDGMDKPMPMAEFLSAAKAEADELAADAPLMQIAAECALLNGLG